MIFLFEPFKTYWNLHDRTKTIENLAYILTFHYCTFKENIVESQTIYNVYTCLTRLAGMGDTAFG